jgi:branched-chain amino acid transport system ATP-binding protein
MLLEASGLHAYYGDSHVLHGINFGIRRGEVVGLMGRNGMGKSTLLRSMLGFVKKRSGSVKVRGIDRTLAAPHVIARQGIAYVPEGRGIFRNLSVSENLMMAARPRADGSYAWTLQGVLETFPRLSDRLGQGGDELSGGEQQMLSIARALMTNPDLLILDEATEGLAPQVAGQIWETLARLKAAGVAAVVVDRNYRALSALADRAVILVKGLVVFDGSGEELGARPELHQRYLGV